MKVKNKLFVLLYTLWNTATCIQHHFCVYLKNISVVHQVRSTNCTQVQSLLPAWWSTCATAKPRKRRKVSPKWRSCRPDVPKPPRKSTTKSFAALHTFFLSIFLSSRERHALFQQQKANKRMHLKGCLTHQRLMVFWTELVELTQSHRCLTGTARGAMSLQPHPHI